MKQSLGFIFLVFSTIVLLSFKPTEKVEIKWITVQELNELYATNSKPVLIDIYTDWCGWCKEMDRKTYKNEKLARYVNEHYYAVKFNAEDKTDLTFNKKLYKFNKAYKTHDLAIYLTSGQLSYPTTVFMGSVDAQPAPIPGFMKPREIEGPLKYFGERADKKETFVAFNKKLHTEW
jgi:thioredoxin-related protein